jgi:hypothetical protein
MENWGLITYRTTAVLYDDASSDARYKNRVAYVVAHGRIPYASYSSISDHFLMFHRVGSPMVWKPGNDGLVE